ncbi:MAG: pilus assembly protein N-terminal domain-containing protein [Candidatus Brevundimonas colombiensis]|uniref:Pilus assembly protein N-terminal domain-containing protein n=1 Tax=Candidatus Brevundimonas colombiensis TaxID=3121376 RepID=A0AAJ6BME2_9CAUL|nr:pilus assembly protein N-terminal domain-containing protein [Brevundimonas sp.]WEK41212.1 MAG: pilus assembly protein N-terminal domain-containing protein [Brevundimonas sp.]
MSRIPAVLLAAALLAGPVVAKAQDGALNVEIDRSARVQLRGAAASIIVANPQIADVSMVDANTLFIVGKGYGVTEVVAVDGVGRTLFQREIVVSGGATGSVRVWRGAQATEMTCGASCSPSVRSLPAPATTAP